MVDLLLQRFVDLYHAAVAELPTMTKFGAYLNDHYPTIVTVAVVVFVVRIIAEARKNPQ